MRYKYNSGLLDNLGQLNQGVPYWYDNLDGGY